MALNPNGGNVHQDSRNITDSDIRGAFNTGSYVNMGTGQPPAQYRNPRQDRHGKASAPASYQAPSNINNSTIEGAYNHNSEVNMGISQTPRRRDRGPGQHRYYQASAPASYQDPYNINNSTVEGAHNTDSEVTMGIGQTPRQDDQDWDLRAPARVDMSDGEDDNERPGNYSALGRRTVQGHRSGSSHNRTRDSENAAARSGNQSNSYYQPSGYYQENSNPMQQPTRTDYRDADVPMPYNTTASYQDPQRPGYPSHRQWN